MAVPSAPSTTRRGPTAYGHIAATLRSEIADGRYAPEQPLPTEAEIGERFGVSRQTVRRAFQDLVVEGLVQRIPGRGTFVHRRQGKYLRSSGSIDELLALALDSELEIVSPPAVRVHIEAAGRLHLESDRVVHVGFRRWHRGQAYCVTDAYFPEPFGAALIDVEVLQRRHEPQRTTVLGVVQDVTGRRFVSADQTITAEAATSVVAEALGCATGTPVLRIDRVYFDTDDEPLELAVNHFDPSRYTYRFRMQASDT